MNSAATNILGSGFMVRARDLDRSVNGPSVGPLIKSSVAPATNVDFEP